MKLMGFRHLFIHWIQTCITTPSFTISINREFNSFFNSVKGLRQGDPLSPFLFVIVMQVFLLLLNKCTTSMPFKHHWRCKELKLTHLIFADDLMVFSHASIPSLITIKHASDSFSSLFGLYINHSKSQCFITGVNEQMQSSIFSLLGFQEGTLPVKYLGVPLITSMLKANDCRLYWSPNFILPMSIINEMNSIFRSFLWSGPSLKKTGSKVAWDLYCLSKRAGGLGISNLALWNEGRNIWEVKVPSQCSWSWRRLLSLRTAIKPLVKLEIGNGTSANFWFDNWCSLGPLYLLVSSQQLSDSSINTKTKLSSFISNSMCNSGFYNSSTSKLALAALVYNIWMERNRIIFQRKFQYQNTLLHQTLDIIRMKLISSAVTDSPSTRRVNEEWDLPSSIIRPPAKPPDRI
ncbi:uncharacterized protein LOC132296253 [Cornus florida]|uniref:uncharacterized protein LOC132296253 n=1 Tax=Cornus florida TaxID=4283 RepID=UPI00289960F3|nr:uncharacterized protein LOC132296253 [Cornus florida]